MKTPDEFFGASATRYSASAPGRMDVMGGIGDYSGCLVLQMPIAESARVEVSPRTDNVFRVYSANAADVGEKPDVSVKRDDVLSWGDIHYRQVKERMVEAGGAWATYVLGCAFALIKEAGADIQGVDIYLASSVPLGKGVSSSAAIEVATMVALTRAYGLDLSERGLPHLCQHVENIIVGAPCGLMDQLACHYGRAHHLLPIHCQPDGVQQPLRLPDPIQFAGIDSGVRHAVSGASYTDVRVAAFMGYSIIAHQLAISPDRLAGARESGSRKGLPYGGYLANISLDQFTAQFLPLLPARMNGAEFLDRFGDIIDPVTEVRPDVSYGVQACTRHPVGEQARCRAFAALLNTLHDEADPATRETAMIDLGKIMVQTHHSYSACGLGNEATDAIVDAVRDASPRRGVYGAKITGGGSGGTVCVLCRGDEGVATARAIAENIHGDDAVLFTGSSDGAHWRQALASGD